MPVKKKMFIEKLAKKLAEKDKCNRTFSLVTLKLQSRIQKLSYRRVTSAPKTPLLLGTS